MGKKAALFLGTVAILALTKKPGAMGKLLKIVGKKGVLGNAKTGTAIETLKGAAFNNAALAKIGFGKKATGTLVLKSGELAVQIGGIHKLGLIERPDKHFNIVRLKEERGEITLFINGFTQGRECGFEDWLVPHTECFPDEELYGVNWDSGSFLGYLNIIGVSPKSMLKNIALAEQFGTASDNAKKTGRVLGEIISRTNFKKPINLVGHSLGCKVILHTLKYLTSHDCSPVNDVILLGGATDSGDTKTWKEAQYPVNGRIYNCYSSEDNVLKVLYQARKLFKKKPIGIGNVKFPGSKIVNKDYSYLIDSHSAWKEKYEEILRVLYS